jgi:hypothetical protein
VVAREGIDSAAIITGWGGRAIHLELVWRQIFLTSDSAGDDDGVKEASRKR